MQEHDVVKLLSVLEAEYPQSFSRLTDEQKELKKQLWVKEFAHDNAKVVYAAARILMRDGREFAPSSGQIREKMNSLAEKETLEPQQAWAMVAKACTNGYYGYKKEFEKLPDEVQKVVGRAEQLKEWAIMDAEVFQSVIASNFMRNYRVSVEREKELSRIPVEIRNMLGGIVNTKEIEEGKLLDVGKAVF